MVRLGIGAGLVVAGATAFFVWLAAHDAALRNQERANVAVEITAALQEAESRDVANAETAERELPPTPEDAIQLVNLCNADVACRNRGQP